MTDKNIISDKKSEENKKSFVDRLIEKTRPGAGKTTTDIPLGTFDIVNTPIKVIDTNNFFLDDSTGGFITKAAFITHLLSMNKNQLLAFNALFDQMTAGVEIDTPPFEKKDSKRRNYMWISAQHPNGSASFKVLTAGRICSLVGIYQLGIYKCDLSLEALYLSATKSMGNHKLNNTLKKRNEKSK